MSPFRTPYQLDNKATRVLLDAWRCPDCLTFARWSFGPRAGDTSVNITCLACESQFNVSPFIGQVEHL